MAALGRKADAQERDFQITWPSGSFSRYRTFIAARWPDFERQLTAWGGRPVFEGAVTYQRRRVGIQQGLLTPIRSLQLTGNSEEVEGCPEYSYIRYMWRNIGVTNS
jgi:hypothetical protein